MNHQIHLRKNGYFGFMYPVFPGKYPQGFLVWSASKPCIMSSWTVKYFTQTLFICICNLFDNQLPCAKLNSAHGLLKFQCHFMHLVAGPSLIPLSPRCWHIALSMSESLPAQRDGKFTVGLTQILLIGIWAF